MRRHVFALAALAIIATACSKEYQPESQNPEAKGDVKSEIRISVPDTKVAIAEATGVCAWEIGDKIAIFFASEVDEEGDPTAGTRMEFTYDGLYEDGSAKFVTDSAIPTEYVSAQAVYPTASMTETGGNTLVRDYIYNAGSVPVYLRGKVVKNEDGSLSSHLSYNASVMKFTLHDIPAYAAGFVLVSKRPDEVQANGDIKTGATIKITTSFPYKTGYTSDPANYDNDIVLYSAVAHTSVPQQVYLIDGDGDVIEGSEKKFTGDQTVTYDDFIVMPRIDFKKANLRKDYVKVKGVKWAKGNLQCIKGATGEGFQDGWRLAPAQWHHLTYEDNPSEAEAYAYTNNITKYEHFNYGGIARQARFYSDGNYIQPTSTSLDISGKIYSNVHATVEVTGQDAFQELDSFDTNHNKLWGDAAYWASKGKFRLPTAAELKTIHNEVHKLIGVYTTSDGKKVYGQLCVTVLPGETRKNTNGHVFTDADLEIGLFLPKAGRKYDGKGYDINQVTKQGTYRSGTYVKSFDLRDDDDWTKLSCKYVSAYYHISDNAGKGYGPNMANVSEDFGHSAAYLIRPVLVDAE